ncbi:MAG TPA: phosphoglycerate dehydrogenase [Dehalococcoidia bacterium]|nr:phosphoglycerate dehydrogenase [Dehalococcoidia bacterium]
MFRILVSDRIAEDGLAILREHADVDVQTGLSPQELLDRIGAYDALVVRSATKVTADVIAAGVNLKVIGRAGVGVDNIDVEAATRHGVVVANAPEAITVATAEHTIGLMLALARHIPDAHQALREGRWEPSKFVGVELRGKTLGIFGLGRIGSEVARRAKALEMRVIAYDPPLPVERFHTLGVEIATKEEVLEQSDFISLHAPGLASNYHMIDDAEFARMKAGVRIINAARGELMSQEALLRALESGKVAGAALDSFEPEPPPADAPYLRHPRIIVTPHLGASAAEAQERVAVDVAKQVLAVLNGEPAMYAVNAPFIAAEAYQVIAPFLQAATQAASLATQLSTGQLASVEVEYLGELADYDTTPLKAAVIRGLLAPVSEENVTLVNASMIAEQRGLRIIEHKGHYEGIYANLIRVHLRTSTGKTTVSSTVAHDGPHIVEINDFWVDVSPGEGYLLLCENLDRPGMIGRIGTFLGQKDVNISFMRVGREKVRGRALMVLGLDDELTPELLDEIARIPDIYSARTAKI